MMLPDGRSCKSALTARAMSVMRARLELDWVGNQTKEKGSVSGAAEHVGGLRAWSHHAGGDEVHVDTARDRIGGGGEERHPHQPKKKKKGAHRLKGTHQGPASNVTFTGCSGPHVPHGLGDVATLNSLRQPNRADEQERAKWPSKHQGPNDGLETLASERDGPHLGNGLGKAHEALELTRRRRNRLPAAAALAHFCGA